MIGAGLKSLKGEDAGEIKGLSLLRAIVIRGVRGDPGGLRALDAGGRAVVEVVQPVH